MSDRLAAPASLSCDPLAIRHLADEVVARRTEVSAAQARELLDIVPGSEAARELFAGAQRIRDAFVGRSLRCCSVVNVKAGNCSENCSYCAQASGSANVDYKKTKWIPDEDIARASASAAANGAQALGLVAAWWGVKEGAQLDMVCDAIETFSQNGKVRPDVNLGILENQRCADRIKEAGAKVYGHNLETARSFFDNICTTHSFEERLDTIRYIKKSGMGLCSGGIIGMGETREQRVEFMEQLRLIEPDMIPLNFLNPITGTKLGDLPPVDPDEALQTLAVFRFMLPESNLMVAGGKEVVLKDRLHEVFTTGINAVMVGNYLTTLGTEPSFWKEAAARHGLTMRDGVTEIEGAGGSCGSKDCG
ncbi:MAG: biotin synthase BioB [Planctomycetes bacterium]|nr:biotin synthase BioB [Planctomycetota bacterium]